MEAHSSRLGPRAVLWTVDYHLKVDLPVSVAPPTGHRGFGQAVKGCTDQTAPLFPTDSSDRRHQSQKALSRRDQVISTY